MGMRPQLPAPGQGRAVTHRYAGGWGKLLWLPPQVLYSGNLDTSKEQQFQRLCADVAAAVDLANARVRARPYPGDSCSALCLVGFGGQPVRGAGWRPWFHHSRLVIPCGVVDLFQLYQRAAGCQNRRAVAPLWGPADTRARDGICSPVLGLRGFRPGVTDSALRQVYGMQPRWKKYLKVPRQAATEAKFNEILASLEALAEVAWKLQEGPHPSTRCARCLVVLRHPDFETPRPQGACWEGVNACTQCALYEGWAVVMQPWYINPGTQLHLITLQQGPSPRRRGSPVCVVCAVRVCVRAQCYLGSGVLSSSVHMSTCVHANMHSAPSLRSPAVLFLNPILQTCV